ncbi:MAG TPA: VWA domain-containing protein [Pyrinomonadaceae bacterium]|jgi:VWFA-related protein|nr:VWA domain-containing protein [Pyrinomonadaceae bacterium]
MRVQKIFLFLLISLFAASAAFAQKPTPTPVPTPEEVIEDDEPLKVEADVVNILFTASDKDRRLVTSLTKDDIRIFEDGQPQQIFAFQRQVDLPLSLAILIDTSISQERTLPEEKSAAQTFIEDIVRANKDEVAVLSFTGETTLEQGLTGNVSRLRRAVERVEFVPPSGYAGGGVTVGTPPISGTNQSTAGSTAIWDALWVTSDEVLQNAPNGTRRAIILLSDGFDTSSSKRINDAVDKALKADAVIYSIGIGDPFYGGVDQSMLKKIAERTGGQAFFPRSETELQRAFAQIQTELRSQYLIAYEPTNPKKDGTYRKIQIEVKNSALEKQKIRLTHRQGYFAQSETGPKK